MQIEIDETQIMKQIEIEVQKKAKPLIKNLVDKQVSENMILDEGYYQMYHSILGEIIRRIVVEEMEKVR